MEGGSNGNKDKKKKKRVHGASSFLTWCPLQHREHLALGTGKGDARLAATLLAQYWCVTEKLAGPFLSTHWCLWLLLGLFLSSSLYLNSNRPAGKTQSR